MEILMLQFWNRNLCVLCSLIKLHWVNCQKFWMLTERKQDTWWRSRSFWQDARYSNSEICSKELQIQDLLVVDFNTHRVERKGGLRHAKNRNKICHWNTNVTTILCWNPICYDKSIRIWAKKGAKLFIKIVILNLTIHSLYKLFGQISVLFRSIN